MQTAAMRLKMRDREGHRYGCKERKTELKEKKNVKKKSEEDSLTLQRRGVQRIIAEGDVRYKRH